MSEHQSESRQAELSPSILAQLQSFTACDVSDALLKLKVPAAGFIADLTPYSPHENRSNAIDGAATSLVTIAPVSTILFAPKGVAAPDGYPPTNMPEDQHWADITRPDSVVFMKQPPGQTNAICGGIMALRMKVRQVKGVVALGRVRDLAELRSTELPVWAYGTSTVGTGGGSTPWATQVPIEVNGAIIAPDDIAFLDPENGVVVIPRDKLNEVVNLLPRITAADDKVKEDVSKGMSVAEAFRLHR